MLLHRAARAHARARGYNLLGLLVGRGLTPELRPLVEAVSALADAWHATLPGPYDADRAAALHYQTFGFHLHAYQSVFLEPDGRLAGGEAERVRSAYVAAGFAPPADDEPDALAAELAYLGRLCAAEGAAWEEGRAADAEQVRRVQRDFLRRHLLRWIAPLCATLERQEVPFDAALGALLLEFVAEHAEELAVHTRPPPAFPPAPPDPLADPETRLEQVAAWLLAPPHSGLYLGRADLARLARAANLPAGFGERRTMFLGLLRAAGHYDALPALLDALNRTVTEVEVYYAALLEEHPTLAAWVTPWTRRLAGTHHLLAGLRMAWERAGLAG